MPPPSASAWALLLPGVGLAAALGWWLSAPSAPGALVGVAALALGFVLGRRSGRPDRGPGAGEGEVDAPLPTPPPRRTRSGKVVHDINNVLTAVNGRAELLLHSLPDDHPLREDVVHIQEAGREAARLAGSLLVGGGSSLPTAEILSPAGVVRDLLPGLRALLGEDQTLSFHVEEPLPLVAAGRTGVEQILVNLVRNAVAAMPKGAG